MKFDPKRLHDGFLSLEGGMDSHAPPNILRPNQYAFGINTTTRGGYLTHRPGMKRLDLEFENDETRLNFQNGFFQGATYFDTENGNEIIVAAVSGRLYRVQCVSGNRVSMIKNSSAPDPDAFIPFNPTSEQVFFCQAENQLICQNGFDKAVISNGSSCREAGVLEVPCGTVMAYVNGRLWVALADERSFVAGDIAYGDGSRENVIRFTENTFLAEGGAFSVPAGSRGIKAMLPLAQLDSSMGTGTLQVFTENMVFTLNAPVERETWKNLTYPIQTVSLLTAGAVGPYAAVNANGDALFRSPDGIRSMIMARRQFGDWGNTTIGREVWRALKNDTESLLYACSAVNFDNRCLMTCAPCWSERGVFHRGLVAVNFDPISSMMNRTPPSWDGLWTGGRFLHLVTGRFNRNRRAFVFVLGGTDNLELWEITRDARTDHDDSMIPWTVETPSYSFASPFDLKRLTGAELWVGNLYGEVGIKAYFRSDQSGCWVEWKEFSECAERQPCGLDLCATPATRQPQTRSRMCLPQPADSVNTANGKLERDGCEFQVRLEINGSCVLRQMRLVSELRAESGYGTLVT